jgi:hypothetical protein
MALAPSFGRGGAALAEPERANRNKNPSCFFATGIFVYVDCFNNTGSLTSKSKHSDYNKSNYDFAFYMDAKYTSTDAAEFKARLKKVNDFFSD